MWYLEFEWYAVFPIGLSLYLYYNFALKFITKFIRWLVKAYSHLIMRKTHYSISSEVPALEDQLINFTHFLWSFNLHISKLFYYIVTWFYTTNKNPGGDKMNNVFKGLLRSLQKGWRKAIFSPKNTIFDFWSEICKKYD